MAVSLRRALFVLLVATSAWASGTPFEIGSLRGLKDLAIVVEDLHPDIEQDGLDRSTIKTDVELKLRLAGIRIATFAEVPRTGGGRYLYVNVNSTQMKELSLYAVSIRLELVQGVLLARDPTTILPGRTWAVSSVTCVGKNAVSSARDVIKDLVDVFINDYLAANPRKP
jgi:hypothetical protein